MFDDAQDINDKLHAAPFEKLARYWDLILASDGTSSGKHAAIAWLGKNDRFFLLVKILKREDAFHPWLYERCREVEANPDGYLDLWAREHYKSTIITYAGIIQEIVRDPEITIGIFSHTKPVARKFLRQIKYELESNDLLRGIYPDVFWQDPKRESPRWSEDGGLVVKRSTNPKESTIEAHGLVDGMPTGAHFSLRVYDDVVTLDSVTTPEQVQKTTDAWALSDNLGARGADGRSRAWHIGTRYSFADTYNDILERKVLKQRIYPATDDGSMDGKPIFLPQHVWEEKKKTQGASILAAQMLQNPAAGNQAMFKREWLKFLDIRPATLNIYIMVDPASSRKKGSDRTAMPVVAIDAAGNKYLIDGFHHRMQLKERYVTMRNLRRHWMRQPGVQSVYVGYERYGMTSDLEYFEEAMERDKDVFEITELAWPREGPGSKVDRVQRLEPDFRNGRFYLAKVCEQETQAQKRMRDSGQEYRIFGPTKRVDEEGRIYSLNKNFIEEFLVFPFCVHDDLIDATSRIYDMDPQPPILIDQDTLEPEVFADGS